MIPWHRLFGLTLIDFFHGSFYKVELERDLSRRQKYVDIVIVRKSGGAAPELLPDGLENLAPHNLITYKSHQEPVKGQTIEELEGYYSDYQKDVSPSLDNLLPRENFNLYAVSTRFPEKLAKRIELRPAEAPGIYDIRWGLRDIRVIVLSRIEKTEKNAAWLMFSAVSDKVSYGAKAYNWKTRVSSIINRLFEKYSIEGVAMPYTMEDYLRETREEAIGSFTQADIDRILRNLRPEDRLRGLKPEEVLGRFRPEERLRGLRPEERMRGLKPEEVLGGFRPEERLRGLKPEEILEGFRPEERLKGLTSEEIEAYLKKMKQREH